MTMTAELIVFEPNRSTRSDPFDQTDRLLSALGEYTSAELLDTMVGARIRVFRIHRKISQTDLAEQIGVTFQQVQKYEKGTNRIGASRLSRIATVLGVSVGELFESPGEKSSDSTLLFRL